MLIVGWVAMWRRSSFFLRVGADAPAPPDTRQTCENAGDHSAEMNAALRPGLHRPMQPGSLDHSVSTGRDQAALTGIFFSAFCASALFGNVTFSTPFLKVASI
jgi:hypothetical protein